eukprot:CAMPEP_0194489514 /NCGR_PEP_ID=MMETSP0253-20130528/9025_1 /TAXON_ID=2966 /ORGANISM="Noctiluca scintillans" /LENGTH=97 /DNA_ID=CAMNT_0039329985 /DNA_START=683 /DNA_END=974 /DNA_ORIENTATION=+
MSLAPSIQLPLDQNDCESEKDAAETASSSVRDLERVGVILRSAAACRLAVRPSAGSVGALPLWADQDSHHEKAIAFSTPSENQEVGWTKSRCQGLAL